MNEFEYNIKNAPPLIIYKYTTFETALKIINSNSLLFTSPKYFNDPFDLTNALIDKSHNKEILRKWLDKANSYQNKLTNYEKQLRLKDFLLNPGKVKDLLNTTLDNFKNSGGITCFSKSYTNTLMWSHYSDKHAGMCLGFNIPPIIEDRFFLLEVNYANQITPLNFFLDRPEALINWVYTKSHIWSYEEEVRAVFQDQNGLINFEKNCLKEVHFGLRTSFQQQKDFLERLKQLNYRIQKKTFMSMDSKTFNLKENIF